MDYTHKGHRFQLITLLYFILASLILGQILTIMEIEVGIIPGVLISQYGMVGVMVIAYYWMSRSWQDPTSAGSFSVGRLFHIRKLSLVDGLICIGIAWTVMPTLSFINVLSQFFVENAVSDALSATLEYPMIVTLFLTAVTPAVLEELLTRSTIINQYKKHSVLIVCLMSGAFFGFIHMNINQFLYAFVMGMVMCYVMMITGSVLSSMVIHFIVNATGITMLYMADAMLRMFEDSGVLMEDMMVASAETTPAQLAIALVMVLMMMAFLTPVAVILINTLLKRHNKTFRGSLKLPAEVFMGIVEKPAEAHAFGEDMTDALDTKGTQPPAEPKKIWTPAYMAVVVLFALFALLSELLV